MPEVSDLLTPALVLALFARLGAGHAETERPPRRLVEASAAVIW